MVSLLNVWAPVSELDRIQLALRKGSVSVLFLLDENIFKLIT